LQFEEKSLLFLSTTNLFRQWCIRVVTSQTFQNAILILMLVNCIFYGIADYSHIDSYGNPDGTHSIANAIYNGSILPFAAIYTAEFILKVVAMGFFGVSGSYLSDPWNWNDLVVVITGYDILILFDFYLS